MMKARILVLAALNVVLSSYPVTALRLPWFGTQTLCKPDEVSSLSYETIESGRLFSFFYVFLFGYIRGDCVDMCPNLCENTYETSDEDRTCTCTNIAESPTSVPTVSPTSSPTGSATTKSPTSIPTVSPTSLPTGSPTTRSCSGNLNYDDYSNLAIQSEFTSPNDSQYTYSIIGPWTFWWDSTYDHYEDAVWLADFLMVLQCIVKNDLAMRDPPNFAAGYYYNIYIHHGADDAFPDGWVNGQSTDVFGYPYLTLPGEGSHRDENNINHEGFHIFQYDSNSPGFEYAGDSQWYIEASANWYSAFRDPSGAYSFLEAGTIPANPHLALWHSFDNEKPGDPTDWLFQVRQYGMHTWLYYMTEVAGVDPDTITSGFYGNVDMSPQEYHVSRAGNSTLRSIFADWAAHNTNKLDYLTREQYTIAQREVENVGDPNNLHPYVSEYTDSGSGGIQRPDVSLLPRGWAYNVIKVTNTADATYTFQISGDSKGSDGVTNAIFQGRILVVGENGSEITNINMDSNNLEGLGSVTVTATESEIYMIVASVPENYVGYENYGYSFVIERS